MFRVGLLVGRLLTSTDTFAACGSKVYCGDLDSSAEARRYHRVCELNRLDGDSDSIPCEGGTREEALAWIAAG